MKLSMQICLVLAVMSLPAPCGAQALFETGSIYAKSAGFGAGAGIAGALSGKGTPSAVTNALQRLNAPAAGSKSAGVRSRPVAPPPAARGAESETASAALEDWARAEEKQGHKAAAADVYLKLAEQREARYGARDGGVRTAAQKAGDLLASEKQYETAENAYRKALASAVRAYGPGTPDLLPLLNRLTDVCQRQGRFRDAESYATQSYGLTEREYGATDSHTIAAKNVLCSVLEGYVEQLRLNDQSEMAAYQARRLAGFRPVAPATATAGASDATSSGTAPAAASTASPSGSLSTNGGDVIQQKPGAAQ